MDPHERPECHLGRGPASRRCASSGPHRPRPFALLPLSFWPARPGPGSVRPGTHRGTVLRL